MFGPAISGLLLRDLYGFVFFNPRQREVWRFSSFLCCLARCIPWSLTIPRLGHRKCLADSE